MADELRCAEFKGAGLGSKAMGSEVLAKGAPADLVLMDLLQDSARMTELMEQAVRELPAT